MFEQEKALAKRILAGLEDGRLDAAGTFRYVDEADPALIHLLFGWLRAWYPPGHGASDAVLGRLGDLCTRYPKAARLAKEGATDPIVEWFLDEHSYRDLRSGEFIDLVVEKLEG